MYIYIFLFGQVIHNNKNKNWVSEGTFSLGDKVNLDGERDFVLEGGLERKIKTPEVILMRMPMEVFMSIVDVREYICKQKNTKT